MIEWLKLKSHDEQSDIHSIGYNKWFQTDRLLTYIGILYLLRIPVLLFLIGSFITLGGLLPNGPGATFLEGIYDVAWPPSAAETWPDFKIGLRFFLLTLAALMFAITLAAASRNILRCIERFGWEIGDEDTPSFRGIRMLYSVPPLLLVLTIIVGATWTTGVSKLPALVGDIAGVAVFALFFMAGSRFRRPHPWRFLAALIVIILLISPLLTWDGWVTLGIMFAMVAGVQIVALRVKQDPERWIIGSTAGYVKEGKLSGHHLVAVHAFSLALIVYSLIFVLKNLNGRGFNAEYPLIPTLAVLLILGVLVCWTLSGVTFFFDRYRIPVLLPIVIYISFASAFPQSDHFYRLLPAKETVRASPAELLDGQLALPQPVLVSITGGGIRAAAWSVRVLRELQLKSGDQEKFLSSIRLISAVSGGSVGAMYFANAYTNGERLVTAAAGNDEIGTDLVLAHAQASSLDDIALQLAYEDTLLGLAPFLRGIYWEKGHLSLIDGPGIYQDRGMALEDSIKRGPRMGDATLGGWRRDAKQHKRPAVILNSSIVETGKRFLLATTDLRTADEGRRQFVDLYPGNDVPIATAARLSATFPIVSPAARPLARSVYEFSDHAVDGGYTDNYGMASLVEWLDDGLGELSKTPQKLPKQVLIIQIRSSPAVKEGQHDNEFGAIFQLFHPVLTLINARDTGQLSHNDLELDLLKKKWSGSGVTVYSVIFQTPQDDATEPLNWHMTLKDIDNLRRAWGPKMDPNVACVTGFLNGSGSQCE